MTSTGEPYPQLTLFAEDTPANHLQKPATETAPTTLDTFGPNLLDAFAHYDPDTHCWKTSQATFLSDLPRYKQTWPKLGTTQDGIAFKQLQSEHHTNENGCSSSPRWPTPTATAWGSTGQRQILQRRVDNGDITPAEKLAMSAGNGGKLNPEWIEWLMGFPIGWTDLEDLETP
jgi:hypothetical protein